MSIADLISTPEKYNNSKLAKVYSGGGKGFYVEFKV